MTETQFCDSSGLPIRMMAAHKRRFRPKAANWLRYHRPPPVLRVLALTSIDRMIPNFTRHRRGHRAKHPRTARTDAGERTPSEG